MIQPRLRRPAIVPSNGVIRIEVDNFIIFSDCLLIFSLQIKYPAAPEIRQLPIRIERGRLVEVVHCLRIFFLFGVSPAAIVPRQSIFGIQFDCLAEKFRRLLVIALVAIFIALAQFQVRQENFIFLDDLFGDRFFFLSRLSFNVILLEGLDFLVLFFFLLTNDNIVGDDFGHFFGIFLQKLFNVACINIGSNSRTNQIAVHIGQLDDFIIGFEDAQDAARHSDNFVFNHIHVDDF